MRLENKIAIITGAGSGMGRAASLLFAREGAKIAAIDINLATPPRRLRSRSNPRAATRSRLRADVSTSADTIAMVDETIKRFGVPNILYNNAGIEGEGNFLAQLSEEGFDRVIAINLRGVWLGMKAALPHMVKNGGGVIINTASIAGHGRRQRRGGLLRIQSRSTCADAGRGDGVRTLQHPRQCDLPGAIDTPMVTRIKEEAGGSPQSGARTSFFGRIGKPEEIAKTALFLASDDSSFATGAPFIIDGGWTVS